MIHGERDDALWLAGLLEGEGSFDLHRDRYPRIRLGMTDRDVVGRAATLMDARMRLSLRPAPNQATWHTEISGVQAESIMREILPFMGARRSGRIAEILGGVIFRGQVKGEGRTSSPGPQISKPAGITRPATSASLL